MTIFRVKTIYANKVFHLETFINYKIIYKHNDILKHICTITCVFKKIIIYSCTNIFINVIELE